MRKTLGRPDLDAEVAPMTDTSGPRAKRSKGADIQVHIGDKLKALYSEVVNQPVPDHLLDLVMRLEGRSKGP